MFSDGLDILEADLRSTDIILMDIQMQHMDGMKAAERIRLRDKNVIIIFITNLAQYALQPAKGLSSIKIQKVLNISEDKKGARNQAHRRWTEYN